MRVLWVQGWERWIASLAPFLPAAFVTCTVHFVGWATAPVSHPCAPVAACIFCSLVREYMKCVQPKLVWFLALAIPFGEL